MESGTRYRGSRVLASSDPADLPVGTLTFLMTDVEGSTSVWDASPRAAKQAIERHDRIIVDQVRKNQGWLVEGGREGDSILAVFSQAAEAVGCALDIQRSLLGEVWSAGAELRVRIAVHTGEATLQSGHYVGAPLYRCARLMSTAHGGQVLISRATREIVADNLPEGVVLRDLGLHGLRDISRPEYVFQLTHPDLPGDFPPLKSLEPRRTNLPEPLTSFVGREPELAALRRMLKESRMVTLTGPGGIGKTRLAVEVTRRSIDMWPDGSWFVDLTPIEDPAQVTAAVASVVGVSSVEDPIQTLLSVIGTKRVLLVLDNCEHLRAACAEFCETALGRSAALSIVATSRTPLNVPGEAQWRTSGLAGEDAVALFERRARLVAPAYKVGDSNRGDVTRICQRVDDLPLAIELAAARLGAMTERDIALQLTQRLDLLSTTHSADPRHQTMTATIDWSYRLLDTAEAALYSRMSVFRGGASLDGVQAVCSDELVRDVLVPLGGLVDKSMVVFERTDDGDSRYRLLELQGTYAGAKLRETGEVERTRRRHYDYFAKEVALRTSLPTDDLASIAMPNLLQNSWMRREVENLLIAIEWARENVEDQGLGLAVGIAVVPSVPLSRARAMLTELLELEPKPGSAKTTATWVVSHLAGNQGDYQTAHDLAQGLLDEIRASGAPPGTIARVLQALGHSHLGLGQLDRAQSAYDEALSLLNPSYSWVHASLQNSLGILALKRGDFKRARDLLLKSVASQRLVGESLEAANALESLANAQLGCGETDASARSWKEVLRSATVFADRELAITCLGGLSRVATALEEHLRAMRLAAAHARLSRDFGYTDDPFWLQQLLVSQGVSRRKLGPKQSDEAWKQGSAIDLDAAVAYAVEERLELKSDAGLLSRREVEVAGHVAAGLSNRQIAGKLFIAERTVEGHVERIRNKLGVRSRVGIAGWVHHRGLQDGAPRE
jgi:predicted ATPase/class 3 adenylate cyclase/DNA-binding CsgD family transcriptional regulator